MSAPRTVAEEIEVLLKAKCPASLDNGILTLDDGTQIDLSRLAPSIPVHQWDSEAYGGDKPTQEAFEANVSDQRASNGRLYFNFYGYGDPDDEAYFQKQLGVTAEINDLEGIGENLPCLHIHFDDNELAFSCFKKGNSLFIRPERSVQFVVHRLKPDTVFEVKNDN